jgi:hypothetical protein
MHGYNRIGQTYLRTQGNALRTEMMMKMFVMMPLTITAGCCTARYRIMSTILNTSHLKLPLAPFAS